MFRANNVVFIILMLLCISCAKEEKGQKGPDSYPVSVEVIGGTETKTAVDQENKIHWSKGDKLGMLAVAADKTNASAELSLNNVDAGLLTAKFQGNVNMVAYPEKCYFVYPSTTGLSAGASVSATFSYEGQTGVHTPYLYSEAVNYASTGINCTLHHVGGMLRLAVPEGVRKISVIGNNNEKLTPYIYNWTIGAGEVDANGSSSFTVELAAGLSECYIAMPPVNFTKGFSLFFENTAGAMMYKSFNADAGYDFSQNQGTLIDIDVSSFTEFNLAVTAAASHLFTAGNLSGSKVEVNGAALQGAPAKILNGWGVELYNSNNTLVREKEETLAKPADINASNALTMDVVSGWPYLPQGTYTIKPYIILHNNRVYGASQTITVTAPQLTVTTEAKTSYSHYLAGDISAANGCDGSTIYGITCNVNIAPEIISNANYTKPVASYTINGTAGSNVNMTGNSQNFGNLSNQSWAAHTVATAVVFDGVTFNSTKQTVQVTGLPYTANPPKEAEWEKGSWNVEYKDDCVQLGGVSGSGEASVTSKMQFNIPQNINIIVDVYCRIRAFQIWGYINTDFTVKVNGTEIIKQNSNKTEKDYNLSGTSVFTPSGSSIKCESSYTAAGPWAKVYTLTVNYR